MLKLVYSLVSAKRGLVRREELFTANEKRTAVEMARDKRDQPDKFRDVVLLDFSLVKGEVVTVQPTNPDAGRFAPVEVSRKAAKVPACVVVDLSRLPRAKAPAKPRKTPAKVAVAADAFDLPAKPKRVSKRQRAFGVEADRKAVVS